MCIQVFRHNLNSQDIHSFVEHCNSCQHPTWELLLLVSWGICLETPVDQERLQDRVEFLGSIPHTEVRDVFELFLDGIAILEAASCGLFGISTEVGGVPEVLPEDLILMGPPSIAELTKVLACAICKEIHVQEFDDEDGRYSKGDVRTMNNPVKLYRQISKMYSWDRVASRTIQVYEQVLEKERFTFLQRLSCYKTVGIKHAGS